MLHRSGLDGIAPPGLGIAARRARRRAYCGLVRLGPRADGAAEADSAEVTDSPAKEADTERSVKASSMEGRPKGATQADAGEAAKTPGPEDAPAHDADGTPKSPAEPGSAKSTRDENEPTK